MVSKPNTVEVGRVVRINSGKHLGKIAVITDIISFQMVIVDGPCTSVPRQVMTLRSLDILNFLIEIPRGARAKTIRKVFEAEEISKKFQESPLGIAIAKRERRMNLTDFERFQVKQLKKKAAILKPSLLSSLPRIAA